MARALARREGILVGGSSGTNVAAALRYARRLTPRRPGRRPGVRHRPQLPEQVLRRRLAGGEQPAAEASSRPTRSAICCKLRGAAATGDDHPRRDGGRRHRADAVDGHLAAAGAAGRQAGRQHSGGDAGPRAARRQRPERGDGRRGHGPAAAAAGRRRCIWTRRIACCWPGNTGVLAISDGKVVDIVTRIDLVHYWQSMRKE